MSRMYYSNPKYIAKWLAFSAINKKTIEDESQQSSDKHSGTEEASSQSSIVDEESDE